MTPALGISTDVRGYKAITVATKVSAVAVLAMALDLIPQGQWLVAVGLGVVALLLGAFTALVPVEVEGGDPGLAAKVN